MLTLASAAPAQTSQASVSAPVSAPATAVVKVDTAAVDAALTATTNAAGVDTAAKPLGKGTPVITGIRNAVTSVASTVSSAVSSAFGTGTVTARLTARPDIAKEAAWLHSNGWHLDALVQRYAASAGPELNEQENCIAVAIYHEARGKSVDGQMAVARVIMNRAASGKYPASWCATVKQPWQFSFVNPRSGAFPATDTGSNSWRKAVAITRLAVNNVVPTLSNDVLWYHADYVAPSWGRRLTRVNKIGTHIFYRA